MFKRILIAALAGLCVLTAASCAKEEQKPAETAPQKQDLDMPPDEEDKTK